MKKIFFITILSLSSLIISCKTRIPERDSVFPAFTLLVDGDGLRHQFDETFDFDNKVLYLKRGETYKISFMGSDRGGVNSIIWEVQALPPVIDFPAPLPPEWERTTSTIPTTLNTMRWEGDRSNPITGYSITTPVIPNGNTPNAVEEIEMLFLVEDFHFNTLRKFLTLRIYNEMPRIGPR